MARKSSKNKKSKKLARKNGVKKQLPKIAKINLENEKLGQKNEELKKAQKKSLKGGKKALKKEEKLLKTENLFTQNEQEKLPKENKNEEKVFLKKDLGKKNEQKSEVKSEEKKVEKTEQILNLQQNKSRWFGLVVLSLALFMVIIDATILNVSQREIITGLKTNLQSFQWSTTLYALVMTSLLITGGRVGDIFGRKKMFLTGAFVFAVGSVIAGLSKNIETLTLGRSVIAGIGAALMMPATSSLIASNFFGKDRNIAFAIWGMVAGTAAALGPLIGGYFTSTPNFGWEWAFFINVIVVALILLVSKFIPDAQKIEIAEKNKIDFRGVLLSAFGLGAIVYGVIESSTYGLIKAKKEYLFVNGQNYNLPANLSISFYSIIFGSILLIFLYNWLKNARKNQVLPLIDLDLFKYKNFNVGLLVLIVLALGQTGFVFALPAYFQIAHNLNALESGKAMLPFSLAVFISSPLAGYLGAKIKNNYLLIVGFLVAMLGVILTVNNLNNDGNVNTIFPGLFLFGFGFGMINGPINTLTLSQISMEKYGEASGVQGMVRQFGATLGIAVIGTVFLTALSNNIPKNLADSSVMTPKYKEICAKHYSDTGNIYKPVDLKNLPCDAAKNNVQTNELLTDISPNGVQKLWQDIKNGVSNSVIYANKEAFKWNLILFLVAIVLSLSFNENYKNQEKRTV